MPATYDILGLVFGILGLLPMLAYGRSQLPGYKLKQLDATFEETIALLEAAVRDGFVPDDHFEPYIRARLRPLRNWTESTRACVLRANGLHQQIVGMFSGLSSKIETVARVVRGIRERIVSVSDKERRRASEQEYRGLASPFPAGSDRSGPFSLLSTAVGMFSRTKEDESYLEIEMIACLQTLAPHLPDVPAPPPIHFDRLTTTQHQPLRAQSTFELSLRNNGASQYNQGPVTHALPLYQQPAPLAFQEYGPSYRAADEPVLLGHFDPFLQNRPDLTNEDRASRGPTIDQCDLQELLAEVTQRINTNFMQDIASSMQDMAASMRSIEAALGHNLPRAPHASPPSPDVETGLLRPDRGSDFVL
ncbi:hypothetical protein EUX98_g8324 [Antrodiella citrinella]|uniref:Uncharacterized protein n=1 Tax=Antrodiella citrinella TaxID=2447956 RepID=A0A4S4MA02_9APHY|nr:hypothetical protein EUX98_g8324 [Antrodiella citrinella]